MAQKDGLQKDAERKLRGEILGMGNGAGGGGKRKIRIVSFPILPCRPRRYN